ncbi:MAG: FAD:protein FMN transferase [Arenimonas sp.]
MRQAVITFDMGLIRILALIAAIVPIVSCENSDVRHQSITVDGNETVLKVRHASPQILTSASKAIQKILQAQRDQSHAWKPSELSKTNLALASGKAAQISEINLHLLEISRPLYEASDGYYDPSIGSLVKLWGFYTDKFPISREPPNDLQISEWLLHKPNFRGLVVKNKTLPASNPNIQLDFTAILEGVAANDIRRVAGALNVQDALVTMGSDQFTIGTENSRPWTVMLKDPFGGDLGQIDLRGNEALFSSGNFDKFRMAPTGSRWGHILNPRTGKPSQGSAAVLVLHEDAVLADAASSALMAGGPGNFKQLVMRMKLACAMMVTEENELLITTQMKKRVVFFRDPLPLGAPIANGEHCH